MIHYSLAEIFSAGFLWGNIGMTLTSDSANERHRLCHPYPHSKNIGCGGGKFTIMALKRRTRIIYHRYIYLLGNLFVWRTWCARVIVMRLRRDDAEGTFTPTFMCCAKTSKRIMMTVHIYLDVEKHRIYSIGGRVSKRDLKIEK